MNRETNPSSTLKQLKGQEKRLQKDINIAKDTISTQEYKVSRLTGDLLATRQRIRELLKNHELVVSEHAILRFLERKGVINVQETIDEIANATVTQQFRMLGEGKYPIGETGLTAVVSSDGTVVTVTGKG